MGAIITVAFGGARLVISGGGRFIVHRVGWPGLAIGVALIALGAYQLATRRSVLAGATANVRVRRSSTTRGVIAFGITWAVASLGCTLPVLMIVVGSVFTDAGGYVESVGRFVQYAAAGTHRRTLEARRGILSKPLAASHGFFKHVAEALLSNRAH